MKMKRLLLSTSLVLISVAVFAAFPVKNHQPITETSTTAAGNSTTTTTKTAVNSENTSNLSASKANATSKSQANNGGGKSQLAALLLCFFVGVIGIHRFYLGYTWQGIVQLLTLGGCGIWTLIDFIRICTGDLQPKGGSYAKTL